MHYFLFCMLAVSILSIITGRSMMFSRIEAKARELVLVMQLNKYDLAKIAVCHHKTAQRVLKKLHTEGLVHICGWDRNHYTPIARYSIGTVDDVPRPIAKTRAERQRERRANPIYRWKELFDKRRNRAIKKARNENHN